MIFRVGGLTTKSTTLVEADRSAGVVLAEQVDRLAIKFSKETCEGGIKPLSPHTGLFSFVFFSDLGFLSHVFHNRSSHEIHKNENENTKI